MCMTMLLSRSSSSALISFTTYTGAYQLYVSYDERALKLLDLQWRKKTPTVNTSFFCEKNIKIRSAAWQSERHHHRYCTDIQVSVPNHGRGSLNPCPRVAGPFSRRRGPRYPGLEGEEEEGVCVLSFFYPKETKNRESIFS